MNPESGSPDLVPSTHATGKASSVSTTEQASVSSASGGMEGPTPSNHGPADNFTAEWKTRLFSNNKAKHVQYIMNQSARQLCLLLQQHHVLFIAFWKVSDRLSLIRQRSIHEETFLFKFYEQHASQICGTNHDSLDIWDLRAAGLIAKKWKDRMQTRLSPVSDPAVNIFKKLFTPKTAQEFWTKALTNNKGSPPPSGNDVHGQEEYIGPCGQSHFRVTALPLHTSHPWHGKDDLWLPRAPNKIESLRMGKGYAMSTIFSQQERQGMSEPARTAAMVKLSNILSLRRYVNPFHYFHPIFERDHISRGGDFVDGQGETFQSLLRVIQSSLPSEQPQKRQKTSSAVSVLEKAGENIFKNSKLPHPMFFGSCFCNDSFCTPFVLPCFLHTVVHAEFQKAYIRESPYTSDPWPRRQWGILSQEQAQGHGMKDQSILEDAMVGKTCPWKAEWRWYDNPSNIQEFNKALLENNLPLFDAQGKDKHLPAYGLGGYFADLQASPQEGTSRPALEPRAIRGGAYAYHAKWTKEECKADVGGWLNSEEMGAEYHVQSAYWVDHADGKIDAFGILRLGNTFIHAEPWWRSEAPEGFLYAAPMAKHAMVIYHCSNTGRNAQPKLEARALVMPHPVDKMLLDLELQASPQVDSAFFAVVRLVVYGNHTFAGYSPIRIYTYFCR